LFLFWIYIYAAIFFKKEFSLIFDCWLLMAYLFSLDTFFLVFFFYLVHIVLTMSWRFSLILWKSSLVLYLPVGVNLMVRSFIFHRSGFWQWWLNSYQTFLLLSFLITVHNKDVHLFWIFCIGLANMCMES
jgi:hypothetical protein